MNKPKTPPCIGHDQETEVLEDIDTIMDTLIDDLMAPQNAIVIYNDNVNSFDHVITCLIVYCNHTSTQAEQCALIIHNKGKCSVKTGSIEDLTPICKALQDKGLNAEIQ
jgi:ATP-dependent Clp protease adaptor protein ClpS